MALNDHEGEPTVERTTPPQVTEYAGAAATGAATETDVTAAAVDNVLKNAIPHAPNAVAAFASSI